VKINVYTIAGRLVKRVEANNIDQKFVKVDWDGRDEDGDQLGNGTYLYKLIVNTRMESSLRVFSQDVHHQISEQYLKHFNRNNFYIFQTLRER